MESWEEKAGRTKVFGRSLDWIAAQAAEPAAEGDEDDNDGRTPLTTMHLEQSRIGGIVRLSAIGRIRPVPGVHALSGGACTPSDDPRLTACADVGTVVLPPLYAYGLEGGPKLALNAEVRSVVEGVEVSFAVRRNQPEVLDIFPYAHNATQYSLRVGSVLDGPLTTTGAGAGRASLAPPPPAPHVDPPSDAAERPGRLRHRPAAPRGGVRGSPRRPRSTPRGRAGSGRLPPSPRS